MDVCAKSKRANVAKAMDNVAVKECFREYKLEDEVEALKNIFGIGESRKEGSKKRSSITSRLAESGVKECLRPPVPSTFETLVAELRDTVRSGYWNKEIGKTIYLPPHLPAGCDPIGTTFGKASTRDPYTIAEIVAPGDLPTDDRRHVPSRPCPKSYNDYDPSEQIDRDYARPFDRLSSFGVAKKRADFSGYRVANCIRWFDAEPWTLVRTRQADFCNRTESRLGKVKNVEAATRFARLAFRNKDADECRAVDSVANLLQEVGGSCGDIYRSEYTDRISNVPSSSRARKYVGSTAGVPSVRSDVPHALLPDGVPRCDLENLGDQTSAMALVTPSIFTQLGLDHTDFFKIREYEELRSIFESIGVEFPGDSFDVLWREGTRMDRTGGVCVETFRNILGRLAMTNYDNDMLSN